MENTGDPSPHYFTDENADLNDFTDEIHHQRLVNALTRYWEDQMQEMEELQVSTEQDFKNHNDLPLARIKRIMKSDEGTKIVTRKI